jgi:citrate synthase
VSTGQQAPEIPARDQIRTRIWQEEAEPGNPFATQTARCHGYDVYGEMLGQARWVEMLFLLLRGERPSQAQADLLEALAVALANPGPRDPSVHAAMCGGVGGSTAASCLIAALAVGAGRAGGAQEVRACMDELLACGADIEAWTRQCSANEVRRAGVWPHLESRPGFERSPASLSAVGIVAATLVTLSELSAGPWLRWVSCHRAELEQCVQRGVAMTAVAAAAFLDLGMEPEQGEMCFLLLRLPGAAAHALEQAERGYKKFPMFELDLLNDPAEVSA